MTRDPSRPLGLWPATRAVLGLALDGMAWTRRSVLMIALLGLPPLFCLVLRLRLMRVASTPLSPIEAYGWVAAVYYLRNAVPLAALFYATALVADEVEARTLTYFFTRPISRASILLGKFGAYLATTLSLALPALSLSFVLLATSPGSDGLRGALHHLPRDLGAVSLGFLAYGALFALLGVVLRRPLLPGLFFLFAWELLGNLPGHLSRLTLTVWLRSLMLHRPAEEGLAAQIFGSVFYPEGTSLIVLLFASLVFLMLAVAVFERRDYVLEQ